MSQSAEPGQGKVELIAGLLLGLAILNWITMAFLAWALQRPADLPLVLMPLVLVVASLCVSWPVRSRLVGRVLFNLDSAVLGLCALLMAYGLYRHHQKSLEEQAIERKKRVDMERMQEESRERHAQDARRQQQRIDDEEARRHAVQAQPPQQVQAPPH